jgi:urease accessory protein UreH
VLEPRLSNIALPGAMGENQVLGNFYLVSDKPTENLVEKVNSTLKSFESLAGVSPLALTGGLIVRALGPSARVVRGILEKVWNDARMELLGSAAPRLRK